MIDAARENILSRLKTAVGQTPPAAPTACLPVAAFSVLGH